MQWIKCSDRLPKKHQTVLVADRFGNVFSGIYYNGKNFITRHTFGDTVSAVTHWMPLPEPPEELS